MAKRRIQPSDEEIARRAINQARKISGRLFISPAGIYVVYGLPGFRRLRDCLAQFERPPEPPSAPAPLELGFLPDQVTPLNRQTLTAWSRSLQKWRKILQDYEQPRQKTSERRHKYRQWQKEIEELSNTLDDLWDIFRAWETQHTITGTPYVVAGRRTDVVDCHTEAVDSTATWKWFEQVAAWIGGEAAAQRFHESVKPFEQDPDRGVRELLPTIRERLSRLQDQQSELPAPQTTSALHTILCDLPGNFRNRFGLHLPNLPREVPVIADYIAACERALRDTQPPVLLVASAAALCAVDGAKTPIPRNLLGPGDAKSIRTRGRIFLGLFDQRAEPSYDRLLHALRDIHDITAAEIPSVRRLLLTDANVADIQWALCEIPMEIDALAKTGLSPKPLRQIVTLMEESGLKSGNIDASDLADTVTERQSDDIIRAFAEWLSSVDSKLLDASFAQSAWNCLVQLLALEGLSSSIRDRLRLWAQPLRSNENVIESYPDLSPDASAWLARLHHYQKLRGHKPTLPKSIANLIGARTRRSREIEYLRAAQASGALNESMAARLAHLEQTSHVPSRPLDHRVLRQLKEVCARLALEAMTHLAHVEGRRLWADRIGCEPPSHLTPDHITAIAIWAVTLTEDQQQCLDQLLDAWKRFEQDYRRHLPLNKAWLNTAAARLDLEAWLAPAPQEFTVGHRHAQICVALDPFRTLLMGSYFDTCLSLDDFNKHSVLANAYDANKAVLFVLDSGGGVVARKLIALNSSFQLLGYRTYISGDADVTNSDREHVARMIDAYCGRWAERMKVPLGFTGVPTRLAGTFWYDDGTTRWSPSAIWAQAHPKAELETSAAADGNELLPAVAAALESRQHECKALLEEHGIWPPRDEAGEAQSLQNSPGLAEESLALVARRQEDTELAQLVLENAITRGGHSEALSSLTYLTHSEDLFEHMLMVSRHDDDFAERTLEVLRAIGTPDAWRAFMRLTMGEYSYAHGLWLPIGVAGSGRAADAFVSVLARRPDVGSVLHLLLASEIAADHGSSMSAEAVLHVLCANRLEDDERFGLVQWLPLCADRLKRLHLDTVATANDAERHAPLTAVVLALANPTPVATRYLKQVAEHDPAALLALALRAGGKHRQFVRQRAVTFPPSRAAILALLVLEGPVKTTELVDSAFDGPPRHKQLLAEAHDLYAAFENLELGHAWSVQRWPWRRRDEAVPIMPYVLHKIWGWTDPQHPNHRAVSDLIAEPTMVDVMISSRVDLCGLAARIARLLKRSGGRDAMGLRQAVLTLLKTDQLKQNGMNLSSNFR